MGVARQMSAFMGDFGSFMGYERPQSTIDLENDSDGTQRYQLVKTAALAWAIENQIDEFPFKYTEQDARMAVQCYNQIKDEMTLKPFIGDFGSLLDGKLEAEDLLSQDETKQFLAQFPNNRELSNYVMTPEGGGGFVKCHPMKYLQAVYANQYLRS